jgi:alpha-galactosidase
MKMKEDPTKRERSGPGVTRREVLHLAIAAPLLSLTPKDALAQAEAPAGLTLDMIAMSPVRVVFEAPGVDRIRVTRTWDGSLCRTKVVNSGRETVRIKEIVLFDVTHTLPPETHLYGEGFQMLSQTGGTLGTPEDIGDYTDAKHYRLREPAGAKALYGLMTLTPPAGPTSLLAFTSCRRFTGQFYVQGTSLQIVVDTEGREIAYEEEWVLEDFTFRSGDDREALLGETAALLNASHPPLRTPAPPTGWCSWYAFGPSVTAKQVLDNLDVIAKQVPGLKYIQVDDGYQPAMGDWLETGKAFGGDVQGVLKQIRTRGFEPALWSAPFIAERESNVFRQHPDWFVKDAEGRPLPSDQVTFGGWRRGPWYALDGTHPEVQAHLETVFRTLRNDWGCTYLKLDGTFWGAMHGGRFHDPKATRIEAYRRGMEAIRRGAGDAFLLGGNHPMWASLGLLHGSRGSNDIKRTWERVKGTARQNLERNWQNGRLWWNDPDVVVLTGALTEEQFRFHATALYATGGLLLSGDDLTKLGKPKLDMLRKLLPPTGVAARFHDRTLSVGTIDLPGRKVIALLNWDDSPRELSFSVPGPCRIRELWTGEDIRHPGGRFSKPLPAHSGRLLDCET